jgi:NADPH-dependent 2,4-dienoyl-CoA reductase/sulfur reductase-like enzyme
MRILIVGGDAAGMSAASQIRRRQPDWHVTVLEQGDFTSYAACGIPYYLAGDVPAFTDLEVVSAESHRRERGLDVRTGWKAVEIDPVRHHVVARSREGEVDGLTFDRLLLATGASPVVPRWPGVELDGVLAVRDLHDTRRLEQWLTDEIRHAVIVGAGYIGLEMAEALRRRGLEVTVLEKLPGVLGGADPELTERTRKELEAHGVALHLETTVEGFAGEDGRLRAVETTGESYATDVALVSLGVRPNVELAERAGIPLGATGALAVDETQRTGTPDIFAAGDCAEALHRVLGKPVWVPLALTANRQGRVAGTVMAGDPARFPGIVGSAVTRVFDLTLARTGIDEATARKEALAVETVATTAPSKAHYYPGHEPLWVKILYRAGNGKVVGALLAGHDPSAGKRCDVLATAITAGMTIEEVADLDLTYAPPFAPVWDPVLQAANKAVFRREAARMNAVTG